MVVGADTRDMLAAFVAGQDDPAAMAELARGKLRKEIPELKRALKGQVMTHHQFMLEQLLDHLATVHGLEGKSARRGAENAENW